MKENENFEGNFDDDEISPGGSKIYRHKEGPGNQIWVPNQSCVHMEAVCAHFDRLYPGRESIVLHEIVSHLVHIDVHVLKPTENENFYVIFTTGMSDLPMTMPAEMPESHYLHLAELFMYLPASWDFEAAAGPDATAEGFWPVELLKFLARMPHEYATWLGYGHTIPNGPNYNNLIPNSEMAAAVLVDVGRDISELTTENGETINIYMVAPISQAECEFKLEKGMDALLQLFQENDVPFITDIYRGSVV